MQVELDDLDGVGRESDGEVAADIVQGRFRRDDSSGSVDGVGGLCVGGADANEFCIRSRVNARECEVERLGIG